MKFKNNKHLLLGITGASGSNAAEILLEKSPWPVDLIISNWGKKVMIHENVDINFILNKAAREFKNDDLFALPSSGSTTTVGMVILPCSAKTLGEIASGLGSNLISRAAHCHLKERRPLIICLRESPLSTIDIDNAKRISEAGGIIMPVSPPFFMFADFKSEDVSMYDLLSVFVSRIFLLLGCKSGATWENVR